MNITLLSSTSTKQKIVLAGVLLGVVAALGIWLYVLVNQSVTPQTPAPLSVNTEVFDKVEDDVLKQHLHVQANTPQQRFSTEVAGATVTTEIDLSTQATRTVTVGARTSDLIIIGDMYYARDTHDDTWWAQRVEDSTLAPATAKKYAEELSSKADLNYTAQGQEACGELECYKYQVSEQTGVSTMWFAVDSLLLQKTAATIGDSTVTVEYSYNDIVIQTPEPTKNVPEGESIMSYLYGAPEKQPEVDMDARRKELEEIRRELGEIE